MDKAQFLSALQKAKESSPKRNFQQSVDLVVTLKNLDLKKPEQQMDSAANLHYSSGKKIKVCGLVGPELLDEAKQVLDLAISVDDFSKYENNKKVIRKLAKQYDF